VVQAIKFFLTLKHPELELTSGKIEQSFAFAMMTVLDEDKRMKKYEFLAFVEFLEMLCRLALVGITMQDTVEYKVHLLLEIIWARMLELEEFNASDHPLRPVDEGMG